MFLLYYLTYKIDFGMRNSIIFILLNLIIQHIYLFALNKMKILFNLKKFISPNPKYFLNRSWKFYIESKWKIYYFNNVIVNFSHLKIADSLSSLLRFRRKYFNESRQTYYTFRMKISLILIECDDSSGGKTVSVSLFDFFCLVVIISCVLRIKIFIFHVRMGMKLKNLRRFTNVQIRNETEKLWICLFIFFHLSNV